MIDVVITGVGAITPLGTTAPSTWDAMLAGKSGITELPFDWAKELGVAIAGLVPGDPASYFDKANARRLDPVSRLALIAAAEAWADAGFDTDDPNIDLERLGVSIGTGMGGLHSLLDSWDIQKDRGARRMSPFAIPMLMANASAAQVGLKYGAQAMIHTPVSACASGNEAIAYALDVLRLNRADVMLVGGSESLIHPFPMAAFNQMQALSKRTSEPTKASRPWDVDRDGFVMAEGACILVLETLAHAKSRGAKIYGTIAGAGISADSYDIVKPEPTGRGQSQAMTRALTDAQLSPQDICHVNAHATSTPTGDITEAKSIRQNLGVACDNVIVTGTKSMTGHLLGAAGALETFATVMALANRKVPPTINLDNPEPGLGIDIATEVRPLPAGNLAGINNSFGFGGHNVAVVVTNENMTE